MKKIVYTTTLFFIIPTFFVHAYTFTQTMSLGSNSPEVLELQKILNTDSRTQIAESGVGSPGNETTYFGQKTKAAVVRFQNLYAKEILYPNNLTVGTGFVGRSTIEFLNTFDKKSEGENTIFLETNESATSTEAIESTPIVPTETVVAPTTPKNNNEVSFFVSKTILRSKEVLHVGSETPLRGLDIYVGEYKMKPYCRYSEFTCSFRVKLEPGTYTLRTSDTKLGSHQITILDKTQKIPEIPPLSVNLREDNLIRGKFFTDTVKVYTMYGVFESETRDNAFILNFPEKYTRNATTTAEGFFLIENNNGLKSKPRIIKYEI